MHRLFLPLLLGLLAFPGLSAAQVFVSAGVGLPVGPDQVTDLYSSGFGIGAGFSLEHSGYPAVRFRPFGTYQKFQIDDEQLRSEFETPIEDSLNIDVTVSGGDMSVIFAGADLQLRIPYARFSPYIAPAFGILMTAIDDITIEGPSGSTIFNVSNEETAIAVGIGAGFLAGLTERFQVFTEAHYLYAFTQGDNLSWVPIRFGVTYLFDQ